MSLFRNPHADGARLDLDGVPVRLKVNARARRISLRIDLRAGEAVAVAPSARQLITAVDFARDRRDWIAERLAARPTPPVLASGARILVLGESWRLDPDGRRPRLVAESAGQRLAGCGSGEVDRQLVIRAVKRRALEAFEARAQVHCAILGVQRPPIALTDAKGRWGSCAPPRAGSPAMIRLSWRLALAPLATADYVVAHECAHLLQANHGPAFWALTARLVGDVRPHNAWLRRHGAELHAF
jgi:predicted metal-dependent hydrolase